MCALTDGSTTFPGSPVPFCSHHILSCTVAVNSSGSYSNEVQKFIKFRCRLGISVTKCIAWTVCSPLHVVEIRVKMIFKLRSFLCTPQLHGNMSVTVMGVFGVWRGVICGSMLGANRKTSVSATAQVHTFVDLTSRDGKPVSVSTIPVIIRKTPHQKCGSVYSGRRRNAWRDWGTSTCPRRKSLPIIRITILRLLSSSSSLYAEYLYSYP